MRWPTYQARKAAIEAALRTHANNTCPLPGLIPAGAVETLALQIIASLRREAYFSAIRNRGAVEAYRCDPDDDRFEAELAVVHLLQQGNIDEAAWLIFLMTTFAKPAESGWRRLRDVYGRLGQGTINWPEVAAQPDVVEQWLAANWQNVGGKQGNHRQYESMRPDSERPIGRGITQYAEWVVAGGGHAQHFASLIQKAGNSPEAIFDHVFHALPCVGFARLGRFDWVSMLDRYGLITATPETAYLDGATGPLRGVKLLFDGRTDSNSRAGDLQEKLTALDQDLGVGMKVLEDALCNWQKSPTAFVHFKG